MYPVLSLEDFEPQQGKAFWRAKLLRPGGTSSDAALGVGVRTREPPQILLVPQTIWVSLACR